MKGHRLHRMIRCKTKVVHLIVPAVKDICIAEVLPHEIHSSKGQHIERKLFFLEEQSHTLVHSYVIGMTRDAIDVESNDKVDFTLPLLGDQVLSYLVFHDFRVPVSLHTIL